MINKKTVLTMLLGLFLILSALPVSAGPSLKPATVKNPVANEPVRQVIVPEQAAGNSPALVPLGLAIDDGQIVEGYAVIHYKRKRASDRQRAASTGTTCYRFLAKGARWKITEPYVVDPTNSDGLSSTFVRSTVATGLETWDSRVSFEVFGLEDLVSTVNGVDTVAPDGKNEILFGNISDANAIAVATVWGIFYGPTSGRKLVEYDVIFDDPDYTWGDASLNAAVMDFQDIFTHELGHGAGLSDLYDTNCGEETMYGYANAGETKKRDLNTGDIAGIRALYR